MTKERPIIFSAPMIRAILDGRKTQTRRTLKQQPIGSDGTVRTAAEDLATFWHPCPYGRTGDRLWVREGFSSPFARSDNSNGCIYRADADEYMGGPSRGAHRWSANDPSHWRSPIHMPRWASRITLEITNVRVERLQAIIASDAVAEGIESNVPGWKDYGTHAAPFGRCWTSPRDSYMSLWESINGPGSWDANPWVWVIEFRRAAP